MINTFPEPAICRAGCAQQKITPPLGVSLAGYFHDRIGKSVRDDLYARAIVIESSGTRLAIISCDLISISEELSLPAKAIIEKEVGIPPENVLICATHTHTGPEVRPNGVVARSEAWFSNAPRLVAESVKMAANSMFTATIRAGCAEVYGCSFNRLYRLKDGTEQFGVRGRADEVIAEAFLESTAFGNLLEIPQAKPVNLSPAVAIALSSDYRTQARVSIESKTGSFDPDKMGQSSSDEAISLSLTIRQYPPPERKFNPIASFDNQCRLANELISDKIIPNFVKPLVDIIAQKRLR